jgi:hypothetical protein
MPHHAQQELYRDNLNAAPAQQKDYRDNLNAAPAQQKDYQDIPVNFYHLDSVTGIKKG